MNSTIERMCKLIVRCPDDEDRRIALSLLEGARLNATVVDEPVVCRAYIIVIKEHLLTHDILDFECLADVYWTETETEREPGAW